MSFELLMLFSAEGESTYRSVVVSQLLVQLGSRFGVRFYDQEDAEAAQHQAKESEGPDEFRRPVCHFLREDFGSVHFHHVDILRVDESVRDVRRQNRSESVRAEDDAGDERFPVRREVPPRAVERQDHQRPLSSAAWDRVAEDERVEVGHVGSGELARAEHHDEEQEGQSVAEVAVEHHSQQPREDLAHEPDGSDDRRVVDGDASVFVVEVRAEVGVQKREQVVLADANVHEETADYCEDSLRRVGNHAILLFICSSLKSWTMRSA